MINIDDRQFEEFINQAMDELPRQYIEKLDNVAIIYEDEPTTEQRQKLRLRCDQDLYGLYEGIPLTRRGVGYNLVLPDKITIFKKAILMSAHDLHQVKAQVKHTLWHEIAHYYGLDHARIHYLEQK
ncbi:metallopeptidase family protein [Candidatus Saccharibacteria bacterium]|nr:metallopeptidase family protein [Candidatus Saccharibacteria bacterium]MBI3338055.1 metallopeptidase family protein [Candidatus Saccharibacteria bacterium]